MPHTLLNIYDYLKGCRTWRWAGATEAGRRTPTLQESRGARGDGQICWKSFSLLGERGPSLSLMDAGLLHDPGVVQWRLSSTTPEVTHCSACSVHDLSRSSTDPWSPPLPPPFRVYFCRAAFWVRTFIHVVSDTSGGSHVLCGRFVSSPPFYVDVGTTWFWDELSSAW